MSIMEWDTIRHGFTNILHSWRLVFPSSGRINIGAIIIFFLILVTGVRSQITSIESARFDLITPLRYKVDLELFGEFEPPETEEYFEYSGSVDISFTPSVPNLWTFYVPAYDFKRIGARIYDTSGHPHGTATDTKDFSKVEVKRYVEISVDKPFEMNQKYLLRMGFKRRISDDKIGLHRNKFLDPWSGRTPHEDPSFLCRLMNPTYIIAAFHENQTYRAFPCIENERAPVFLNIRTNKSYNIVGTGIRYGTPFTNSPFKRALPTSGQKIYPGQIGLFVGNIIEIPQSSVYKSETAIFSRCGLQSFYEPHGKIISITKKIVRWLIYSYVGINEWSHTSIIILPQLGPRIRDSYDLIYFTEDAIDVSYPFGNWEFAKLLGIRMGRQVFGQIIPPRISQGEWLVEGLARYMRNYVSSVLVGESDGLYEILELQKILREDAQSKLVLNDTEDFSKNQLASQKAGALVKMMEDVLRTKSQYPNENHLQDVLTKLVNSTDFVETNKILKPEHGNYFDPYIKQSGYPMIRVRIIKEIFLKIAQEQFWYRKPDTDNKSKKLWTLPIWHCESACNDTEELEHKLIRDESELIRMRDINWNQDLIVTSFWRNSFYRVRYDDSMYEEIIQRLNNNTFYNEIPQKDCLRLIDDALNLARGGYLSYGIAFRIIEHLHHTPDYFHWAAAYENLKFIIRAFAGQPQVDHIKQFIKDLVKPHYEELRLHDELYETMEQKLLRNIVVDLACLSGLNQCKRDVLNYVSEPRDNFYMGLSPNLRDVVCCNAIRKGKDELFTKFFNLVEHKKRGQKLRAVERKFYIKALTCTSTSKLILKLLQATSNHTGIFTAEESTLVQKLVLENTFGYNKGVRYFIQILSEELVGTFTLTNRNFEESLKMLVNYMYKTTKPFTDLLESAVKRHVLKNETMDAINQVVTQNVKWLNEKLATMTRDATQFKVPQYGVKEQKNSTETNEDNPNNNGTVIDKFEILPEATWIEYLESRLIDDHDTVLSAEVTAVKQKF